MLSLRWPGLVRPMGGMARAEGWPGGRKRDGSDIAKSGGFSACPHSIADLSRFPLSDLSRFPLWPAGMAEGNRETFGPRRLSKNSLSKFISPSHQMACEFQA